MTVIVGFIILLMVSLIVYMGYRLYLKREALILVPFVLQILAVTIAIMAFFTNTYSNNLIEAVYVIFGLVIPACYFVFDYMKMMKKIRDIGVYEGFIEVGSKDEDTTNNISIDKKRINPLIKERQVPEVVKDLNVKREEILRNIKKNLSLAHSFIDSKEYNNAYEIYATIIRIVNSCPSLYYNYANICYYRGNYVDALQGYKKVLELNIKLKEEANMPKEVLSVEKNKKDSRRELYDIPKTADDIEYEEFMVYYNIGNTQFKLGKYSDAIVSYKKAIEINQGLEEANENIARAFIALNQKDDAIGYYKKFVDSDRKNYRGFYTLGRLKYEIGRYNEAQEQFKESIKLNSSFAEGYEALGQTLIKLEKYNEATVAFKKYVKILPQNKDGHINLGRALYKSGNEKLAIESFKKASNLDSNDYVALYGMAQAMMEIGEQDEAINALRKVIDLKEDHTEAYLKLGLVMSNQGRHLEAIAVITNGIKKNPEEHRLYLQMGMTLLDMGKSNEAVDAFKNALEIKSGDKDISIQLGIALIEMKRYSEAIDVYKKALKTNDDNSEIHYGLATVYGLLRKHDLATDSLRKSIELNVGFKAKAMSDEAFNDIRHKAEFKELVS